MSTETDYRVLAADCDHRAENEISPIMKAEWERMSLAYHRLAEQADRNAAPDFVYQASSQPQAQQQQQARPNKGS